MKKFDEWSEAEEWARENNRSLEPIGTCTGDERTLQSFDNGTTLVELVQRVAEAVAIGERNEVMVNIKEYIVVTSRSDGYAWDTDGLYHADDLQDAMDDFASTVKECK